MQTLKEQIENRIKELKSMVPEGTIEQFFEYIDSMKDGELAKDAIKVGDTLPLDTSLINVSGGKENISDIVDAPTVITFYRGSWCPYCNLELKAYQNILPEIKAKGAKLIAISPELADSSLSFKEKNELEFGVYSDINNVFAKKLGLVFKLEDKINDLQKSLGFDVDATNGNTSGELPFGATIVVDKNGKVTYAFVDENFTLRAEPRDILKELDKLI